MPVKRQNNKIVLTSALNMCEKCCDVENVENIFSRIEKNVVTDGAMMMGKSIYFSCSIHFLFSFRMLYVKQLAI